MPANTLVIVVSTVVFLLAIYLASAFINKRSAQKKGGVSEADWNIGGRDLPIFVIIGTQFASAMGGGVIVGGVGNAYSNGIAVLVYAVAGCLAFLVYMLIANWIREREFQTIPDMVGAMCNQDRFARILAALLTIIVPFGWVISQLSAFAKVYYEITGIPINILIIIMAVISILFVMPSGMKTVAWTDFLFSVVMMSMAVIVFAFVFKNGGSPSEIAALVPSELHEFPGGLVNVGWSTILLWIFAALPGGMTNQMYYQRICAMRNKRQVNKSLAISFIVCMVLWVWVCYMGLGIHAMNPNLDGEMATGWLLSKLPVALIALFGAMIASTIMSTISSAVQSVVVNLVHDVYCELHPEVSSQKQVRLSKVLSVIILGIGACLAILYPQVLDTIVASYAYSAAGLVVPMYLCYVLRNTGIVTPIAIRCSMIAGILGAIIAQLMNTWLPYAVWGVVVSAVVLVVVGSITRHKYSQKQIIESKEKEQ